MELGYGGTCRFTEHREQRVNTEVLSGCFLSLLPFPHSPVTKEHGQLSPLRTLCVLTRQVCSLERFRSLQDKLQLLEEAVGMHDGNVITAVSVSCVLACSVAPENKNWFHSGVRVKSLAFFLRHRVLRKFAPGSASGACILCGTVHCH